MCRLSGLLPYYPLHPALLTSGVTHSHTPTSARKKAVCRTSGLPSLPRYLDAFLLSSSASRLTNPMYSTWSTYSVAQAEDDLSALT